MNNLHVEGHVHRANVQRKTGNWKLEIEPDGHPLIAEAVAWFFGINLVFWGCVMVWRYFL